MSRATKIGCAVAPDRPLLSPAVSGTQSYEKHNFCAQGIHPGKYLFVETMQMSSVGTNVSQIMIYS